MAAKFIHIVLACSVLFSTTGILLGKHLCKKEMQAMATEKTNCKMTCGSEAGGCDKDCCSHEFEYFQSDQDKLVQNLNLPGLHKPALLAAVWLIFESELPTFYQQAVLYQTYRPPIVKRDIPVLFQAFLI